MLNGRFALPCSPYLCDFFFDLKDSTLYLGLFEKKQLKADVVDHFLCLHVQLFEVVQAFLRQLILADKQVIIAVISKNKFRKRDT